jgi:4-amino-4-deoxy-L-arabinose transferase-like glycosyltransferase
LFGVSEAAARLPSAISALLATLALAWLALRLYGRQTALWLLLLLPTTVAMIGFSHAAATDMPFSAMLTIAMVVATVILGIIAEHSPVAPGTAAISDTVISADTAPSRPTIISRWLAYILFGFFLGLAVLAKGPAAIILCGGAVFFWALFTKQWRAAFRLLHPAAIATFCLTALPWYILCARRNPDFFRIFIVEHNFKRFLTPEFQHIQPFWYYVPILLIAVLPWTLGLLWAAWTRLSARRNNPLSASSFYFLSWALFCIVFFSISKSKLPGYILPSIPPLGLLIAHACADVPPDKRRSFRFALIGSALLLSGFATVGFALALHPKSSAINRNAAYALVAIALLVSASNLLLGGLYASLSRPRTCLARSASPALCVLPVLAALLFTNHFVSSFFPADPSGRMLALQLHEKNIPAAHLYVSNMNRGMHYSLNFYLHEEIKDWRLDDSQTEGYLLTQSRNCKDIVSSSIFCERDPQELVGWFLFRLTRKNSLRGASGSRQLR